MGSSGEGGERWWQSSQLTPADLRQHAESWSLAADAATATLLQSISQRLVSRTHEVEGALERVVEEADRVLTSISNTNNAFHMLANTQFIENRTYQDDADVANREKPEPKEKQVTVTEDEVLSKCRAALTDGLTLAGTCYDRHEIQDSDTEDEDSPDSPVPVYALIDPYEGRPLPLIIGSEGFLADDKVGLRDDVTSSDENSKATTLSPDETDNESGEDTRDETDRVALTPKTIPATSSRLTDDESDSDWTDDGGLAPMVIPGRPQPPQLSSDEDDDDDDEDFFGPSSKARRSVLSLYSVPVLHFYAVFINYGTTG
ncbi:hypothetical protein Pcinc_017738 [Petrolisthes cinctipes]|uniref:Uncharacterized protein n=1 Tax=Petrolisthes cinctipes TaxID=88211 RepID=A0AAE1KNF9_PETCI|nr:hypothetical protein Pcinc_017738 [Petrolisthes cinctipes]